MGKSKNKSDNSFVMGAFILAIAGLLVRVIGFLYRLPLTNMIGDEGNGIYAAGYNVYNFFLILSSAGLPAAISKMVAERLAVEQFTNAKKIFRVSMWVSGGISLGFALLMAAGTFVFARLCELSGNPALTSGLWYSSVWCLYSLAPTVFVVGILAVYRGYFQGFQTMTPTSVSQIVEQIFNAFFSVYLAYLFMKVMGLGVEFGAAGGTAGTGLGAVAGLGVLLLYYFKTAGERRQLFNTDKKNYKVDSGKKIASELIRIALPIIAGTAVFSIANFIDMFMIEGRLGAAGFDAETIKKLYGQLSGKYVTLSTLPISISAAVAMAVIPSIAASVVKKEMETARTKLDVALRLTMIISVPAAAGLGALGSPILQMLFPSYPEGGSLITVGAMGVIFLSLCQISTGVLQGLGEVKKPAINAFWGAAAKIPINYFLIAIPSINIYGAVISTSVCYLIPSILNLKAVVKITGKSPDYLSILVKPLIASIVMAVICIGAYKGLYALVGMNTVATIGAIVIAMAAYLVVMVLIKGFKREDLEMLPMGGKMIKALEKINRI